MLELLKAIYGIVDPTPEQQIERIKELMGLKPDNGYGENEPPKVIKENKEKLKKSLEKDVKKDMTEAAKNELKKLRDIINQL